MPLPVADQSRLLRELLPADITGVRSLTGVYQDVLLLSGPPRELLAADRAGERPDAFVDPQMEVQVSLLAERLAASRANNLLLPLVPEQVLLEVALRRHATLAEAALVRGLVVPVLHVRLQRGHALASVAANRADDRRRVAVHLLRVLHHVVLDLELLAADRARIVEAARVLTDEMVLQRPPVVALVLADGARVQHGPVDLFRMLLQVFSQPERLAAAFAPVSVLLHVRRQKRLPLELFPTKVTLQRQFRLFPRLSRVKLLSSSRRLRGDGFDRLSCFQTSRHRHSADLQVCSSDSISLSSSVRLRQGIRVLYFDGARFLEGIRVAAVQWVQRRRTKTD